MTLHLYIARRFLFSFTAILMILTGVFILIDMVEGMRMFDAAEIGLAQVFGMTLLHVPEGLYKLLPLVVILSTIWMFLSLARSSEMVVTRAAGRSALLTLVSPAITVLLFGILSVTVFNPLVAATSKKYIQLSEEYGVAHNSVLSISNEGVWLRQGNAKGQIVIHAERTDAEGTRLSNVTFFAFAPDGAPTQRVEAKRAELRPGRWSLQDAKVWDLGTDDNPETAARSHPVYWLASNLTEEQIRDSFSNVNAIAIWDLPAFIAQLERAGFSARAHRVWFNVELATPLFLVAMVLIGAGFTMRHTRMGRTGMMVLFALMMGFGAYFIRNFAQILGENGQIPILLAAWFPTLAAILLPMGILLHLEDG